MSLSKVNGTQRIISAARKNVLSQTWVIKEGTGIPGRLWSFLCQLSGGSRVLRASPAPHPALPLSSLGSVARAGLRVCPGRASPAAPCPPCPGQSPALQGWGFAAPGSETAPQCEFHGCSQLLAQRQNKNIYCPAALIKMVQDISESSLGREWDLPTCGCPWWSWSPPDYWLQGAVFPLPSQQVCSCSPNNPPLLEKHSLTFVGQERFSMCLTPL